MTAAQAWARHKRKCRRCQWQWKHWEDGEMTCDEGVGLFIAARRAEEQELTLFELGEAS